MKDKITCVDIDKNKIEVDVKDLKFRPAVYGVLIENNQILLSKQWDGYDFPGGGIEIDETIEEALVREFWEETGLKVKVKQVVDCRTSFFIKVFSKEPVNNILIYFLVEKIGGDLNIDNIAKNEKQYIGMPEWIDLDKIEKIKFYNSINSEKVIKEAIELLK